MRRHRPEDLSRFLEAVDRHLSGPERLVVIGGAAAALSYGAQRATVDIDVATAPSPALESAIQRAGEETGLHLPVDRPGVWDAPYEFESRLKKLDRPRLQRLEILVPERHDLALMKVLRGYQHDIEVIAEIHARDALDLQTLVERFRNEMSHVVGDPSTHRLSLLLLIETLFGPEAAEKAEADLPPID